MKSCLKTHSHVCVLVCGMLGVLVYQVVGNSAAMILNATTLNEENNMQHKCASKLADMFVSWW
jgi:hypothetical protein